MIVFAATRWLGVAACAMALLGCATAPLADPIAVMLDREADYGRRRTAARQALVTRRDDPAYREALDRIIWDAGYPSWQRIDAITTLVELDEADLRRKLAVRLLQLPDRPTLDFVIQMAAERGWSEFTLPILRSWARPNRLVADPDRPEREALRRLHGSGSETAILLDILVNADNRAALSHQIDAWDLLNRIADGPGLLLSHAPWPTGSLPNRLLEAQRQVGIMPTTGEELRWLLYLLSEEQSSQWNDMVRAVQRLPEAHRRELALRHLPILALLTGDDPAWTMSFDALLAQVRQTLASAERYRAELVDGSLEPQDWAQHLCFADLLVLRELTGALREPQVVESLFRQADADRKDTSTEFGGVLTRDEAGHWRAWMHRPLTRRGDHVFIPPPGMIRDLYTGCFHYHFHVQEYDNQYHAAPGPGDRRLAERLNFNFIVLTFVDRDRLNVDYYQKGGVVIDLGVINRPLQ